jgi:kynureninase
MNMAAPYTATRASAVELDTGDSLKKFREEFNFPTDDRGNSCIYLCGNSLGLQPKRAARFVQEELDDWASFAVEGHFHARRPWLSYHRQATADLALLCGAEEREVVAMNTLTVNLHLLMASFYRPWGTCRKILIESMAFPSDRFAVESQLRFHGYDPESALLEWSPRDGEQELHLDDLQSILNKNRGKIALLLLPGVQYYSGQSLDMAAVCRMAHAAGCNVGLDLAHAIGNVPLRLHDWAPDFAVWCSYKYFNSGPGAVGGAFVHDRHLGSDGSQTLLGWWGNQEATRFRMQPDFEPSDTAELWQLSNPPILSLAPGVASLQLFREAGIKALCNKSERLTGYLEFLLEDAFGDRIVCITPPAARGCQLSLKVVDPAVNARDVFDRLSAQHVTADWREPDAIRVAPVPMYNSFADVFEFTARLKRAMDGDRPQ